MYTVNFASKLTCSFIIYFVDHELWWLENILEHRNFETDTPAVLLKVINALIEDVLSGNIVGAYYYEHQVAGQHLPILFTHGGISPEYYTHLEKKSPELATLKQSGGNAAKFLAEHISAGLKDAVTHTCTAVNYKNPSSQLPKCVLKGQLFAAGKERGGGPVGGPFWSGKCLLAVAVRHLCRLAVCHSIGMVLCSYRFLGHAAKCSSGFL